MYYSIVLSLAFSGLVLQLQFSCSESILELRMSGSVACNIGKDRKIDVGGHGSRFFGPNHPFHLFQIWISAPSNLGGMAAWHKFGFMDLDIIANLKDILQCCLASLISLQF